MKYGLIQRAHASRELFIGSLLFIPVIASQEPSGGSIAPFLELEKLRLQGFCLKLEMQHLNLSLIANILLVN